MNSAELNEAVDQMKVQCDLAMTGYRMMSARSCLRELGYDADQVDEVIRHIAAGGFDYCLDPIISPDVQSSVCYWGPDQLKSRLDCLR